ncbi:MAG: DNA repair protein RadC [Bacteroidales bacterium]|nr:DNA repair protein RadC [Bacteroidales bacterium]
MKIKEIEQKERPREKMLSKGIDSLSDAELLAILLRTGTKKESAIEIANRILKDSDYNLSELSKKSIKDFVTNYIGIGETKAVTVKAALELGRRRNICEAKKKFSIFSSSDIYNYLKPKFIDLNHEVFMVVYLNQSNKIIKDKIISSGGVSETSVDPRIILKEGIELLSSAIILSHNHPSGNYKPSKADDAFTKKMKDAASLFDIRVLDHIIVCEDHYYSYADEGRI